jgi:carboxylesterase type B
MNLPYGKKVADYYIDGLKDDDKIGLAQAASSSMGDLFVTCPTVLFGSMAAKWGINNNVYAYVLAESPTNSFFEKNDTSVIWRGVCHGEDLLYLFGAPLRDGQQWPEKDKELSRNFIKVWTTFAKTG